MRKIVFWGWYSDYDCHTIISLGKFYEVKNLSMSKLTRLIFKLIRIILPSSFNSRVINFFLKRKLNLEATVIFSDDIIYYPLLISSLNRPRKIVVFRNIIPKKFSAQLSKLKKNEFELYTFDPTDAEYFDITFKGQYLPIYALNNIRYLDKAYFLGMNKGRSKVLEHLSNVLISKGIEADVRIIDKDTTIFSFLRKKVSYLQNVRNVLESKYIIDIVREGQDGLTLRVLESAFYQRKLITNNRKVKDYDVFDSNNVLILNEKMEIPDEFLNSEYVNIPDSVLDKYKSDSYYIDIIEKVS